MPIAASRGCPAPSLAGPLAPPDPRRFFLVPPAAFLLFRGPRRWRARDVGRSEPGFGALLAGTLPWPLAG